MAETTNETTSRKLAVRYSGRIEQVGIYFKKFLRMFLYQSDWKVLPMSALIAGLVGMVMNASLFRTMEGTLMGAFALVMVCIWNGCFNSIQVICRERDVIKREHRSGMHISSYIASHKLYQAMLCLMQTAITLFVTSWVGVRYDLCKPLFSHFFIVEFGLSMFLITYASDMMALWISTLCRNTTTAMTIMPFVLIFQLVFSGGMLSLPKWSAPLTALTISSPGLEVIAAQGDTNNRPLVSIWNSIQGMGNTELSGTFNVGQALDFIESDLPLAKQLRDKEISVEISVGQVMDFLSDESDPQARQLREVPINGTMLLDVLPKLIDDGEQTQDVEPGIPSFLQGLTGFLRDTGVLESAASSVSTVSTTLGELVDKANELGVMDPYRDQKVKITRTIGQLAEMAAADGGQELREKSFPIKTSIAELQSIVGVDAVRTFLQKTAAAGRIKPAYDNTRTNVALYWLRLVGFSLFFSCMSVITLEFIDKDKR